MHSHPPSPLLQKQDILNERVLSESFGIPVENVRFFECAESTNTIAKKWAAQGAPHGSVVAAQSQSGGRGRMGRFFSSPPGGIYMSVILRPELSPADASVITAAAAVAVCDAVSRLCEIELGIKWVNDLFFEGRKCCGILAEAGMGLNPGKLEYIVAGIGLDFSVPGFPPELEETAVSLYSKTIPPVTRAQLAGMIYQRIIEITAKLPQTDFMEDYIKRSILIGKTVTVCAEPPYKAMVLGIDNKAHLELQKENGEITKLFAGEVSIKI